MRFPRKLIIGQSEWRIVYLKEVAPPDAKGRPTLGFCDCENQVIEIRTKQPPLERLETICHEIIHAFEDEHDMKIPHDLVESLAVAAARFIWDNFL